MSGAPDQPEAPDLSGARVHLFVEGRVQGVYDRATAAAEAERLGLSGWVRNRRDGRVELVAEGPRSALDALVTWCRRGPPTAAVSAVEAHWDAPSGGAAGFVVRPTA
jgi:acylphosphatase